MNVTLVWEGWKEQKGELVEPIGTRGPQFPGGYLLILIEGEEYMYEKGVEVDEWFEVNDSQTPITIVTEAGEIL